MFTEGYHELHHDKDKNNVKTLISDWMLKRLQANPKKIGK